MGTTQFHANLGKVIIIILSLIPVILDQFYEYSFIIHSCRELYEVLTYILQKDLNNF